MVNEFSNIDLTRVRQLRQFKIDYSRVRTLDYIDREQRPPQTFTEFRQIVPLLPMVVEEQTRPTFPTDLRYLQDYSTLQFPKGKVLILVNYDLYPSIKAATDQYIKDLAYEGYFAIAYRVQNGTPVELRDFIKSKLPIVGVLMVGSLPVAWLTA